VKNITAIGKVPRQISSKPKCSTRRLLIMLCRVLAISFILLPILSGQQQPSFEVASVKPAPAGDSLSINIDGGTARYSNLTLRMFIAIASRIDNSRVVGGPSWLDSDHFDIVAKLPAGANKQQIPDMLATLLRERFKVLLHRESKEQKVLALVVAKGGPKLTKSEDTSGGSGTVRPDGMKIRGATMVTLARMLKTPVGIEVVDRTGIEGAYDIEMKWRKDENSDQPDLTTAIQEQLGLKLEPSRAPVEVVVVDSAERVPIEN
jgi:uncharacterized protein (TIGR03435 family)